MRRVPYLGLIVGIISTTLIPASAFAAIARDTTLAIGSGVRSFTVAGNYIGCFSIDNPSVFTYGAVTGTKVGTQTGYGGETDNYIYFYPVSAGTADVTLTGSSNYWCASYSGVVSIDDTSGAGASSGTTKNTSVTTTASGSWVVGALRTGNTPTLDSGTVANTVNGSTVSIDSNGSVSVGTYSLGYTNGHASGGTVYAVALNPNAPVSVTGYSDIQAAADIFAPTQQEYLLIVALVLFFLSVPFWEKTLSVSSNSYDL